MQLRTLPSRALALTLIAIPRIVVASTALGDANEINTGGVGSTDLKGVIVNIVRKILDFVALIAVIMIIIAGIYMIVGLGSDSSKETAKKIVIYTIIGLILILIARAIVTFVITTVS